MDWKDYKLDEKSIAAILKSFEDNPERQYQYVQEVRYIITTGANWKGPIKKFRLEVTPLEPDALVLCNWPGDVTRMPDGKYVVEVTNFTPKEDLKLLFLKPAPANRFDAYVHTKHSSSYGGATDMSESARTC